MCCLLGDLSSFGVNVIRGFTVCVVYNVGVGCIMYLKNFSHRIDTWVGALPVRLSLHNNATLKDAIRYVPGNVV